MRSLIEKLPFPVVAALGATLFYLSVAIYIVFLPLIFLHSALVCILGWFVFAKRGKGLIIIHSSTDRSAEWLSRLRSLADPGTMFLDYDDRRNWKSLSFPVRAFEAFGPRSIPEQFTPGLLPAIIVLKKFRWPRTFAFGPRCQEPDLKWEQLLATLR